jgi:tRNA-dihydrouridine synthase B
MSGVTDLPYRLIARSVGCKFAFTEMLDVMALGSMRKRTGHLLSSRPEDQPLGVQLVGSREEEFLLALERLERLTFQVLDVNAACPARTVTNKGAGAALLKDPRRLARIVKTLSSRSPVPVTVKIRSGWDDDSLNAPEVALLMEDVGAKALFIHGRSGSQGYAGEVDYATIGAVKRSLTIPVIASGSSFNPSMVARMFDETGCDGVAVARGALGNPWILRDIEECRSVATISHVPLAERIDLMRRHLHLSIDCYGESGGVSSFRKHFVWYTRGFPRMNHLRRTVFGVKTETEMLSLFTEFHARAKKAGSVDRASPIV